jgi:hypothetical protein
VYLCKGVDIVFDIFNIIGLILVLSVLYSSSNKYHRLVKLERLENVGVSENVYQAYDKRLRLECIWLVVVVGFTSLLKYFVNALTLAAIMFILGATLKVLINKYSPIPK